MSEESTPSSSVAADELRQFVERAERLEEEKKAIADDIRELFGEAKSRGFDVKALRAIIRLRKRKKQSAKKKKRCLIFINRPWAWLRSLFKR